MADYGMATGIVNEAVYNSTASKPSNKKGELGKHDFLALLIAQLKYQDPLNPMEDKEFIGQLTQFSTLEQITNMSSNLEKFLQNQQTQNIASISGMIGLDVRDGKGEGGVVTGVSIEDDGTYLVVGDKKIDIKDVKKVNYSN